MTCLNSEDLLEELTYVLESAISDGIDPILVVASAIEAVAAAHSSIEEELSESQANELAAVGRKIVELAKVMRGSAENSSQFEEAAVAFAAVVSELSAEADSIAGRCKLRAIAGSNVAANLDRFAAEIDLATKAAIAGDAAAPTKKGSVH